MLFKPKPPVDLDEFEWLLACFTWLHRQVTPHLAPGENTRSIAVPDHPEIARARSANDLFDAVKLIAGLQDWPCELVQGEARREPLSVGGPFEASDRFAQGTFSVEGNVAVIRYAPELLDDAAALTATLAHELAHYLLATFDLPPGGEDLHEHATDCAAGYLGFGVYLANGARHFAQFQDGTWAGWQSSTSGYLSERAHVTVLAFFVRLNEIEPDLARKWLKSHLQSDFKKALKYVDWRFKDFPLAVQELDLSEWVD